MNDISEFAVAIAQRDDLGQIIDDENLPDDSPRYRNSQDWIKGEEELVRSLLNQHDVPHDEDSLPRYQMLVRLLLHLRRGLRSHPIHDPDAPIGRALAVGNQHDESPRHPWVTNQAMNKLLDAEDAHEQEEVWRRTIEYRWHTNAGWDCGQMAELIIAPADELADRTRHDYQAGIAQLGRITRYHTLSGQESAALRSIQQRALRQHRTHQPTREEDPDCQLCQEAQVLTTA